MKRFRQILVVVPENAPTGTLLAWLRELGVASSPSGVDLLLVADDYAAGYLAEDATGEPEADLQEWTAKLGALLPGVPVEVSRVVGDPLRKILERLARGTYDLVLVPADDRDSRALAERVSRKSPVGVLAVPSGAPPVPTGVLVGIDFSDLSPLCLDWAEAFATLGDTGASRMMAVHLVAAPARTRASMALNPAELLAQIRDSARGELERFVDGNARDASRWEVSVLESQWPSGELCRLAGEDDFDLVVLGSHGRSALSIALLGSQAGEVLRQCDKPVLVVKRKNENLGFVRELLGIPN